MDGNGFWYSSYRGDDLFIYMCEVNNDCDCVDMLGQIKKKQSISEMDTN